MSQDNTQLSLCPGIVVQRTASLPLAYPRASTPYLVATKAGMAGTSPAMTNDGLGDLP